MCCKQHPLELALGAVTVPERAEVPRVQPPIILDKDFLRLRHVAILDKR